MSTCDKEEHDLDDPAGVLGFLAIDARAIADACGAHADELVKLRDLVKEGRVKIGPDALMVLQLAASIGHRERHNAEERFAQKTAALREFTSKAKADADH